MRAALVLALLLAGCGADSGPAERSAAPEPPPPNATPILITKAREQLDEELRKAGGPFGFANRGPGTFYHLVDPATNRLAKARALPVSTK